MLLKIANINACSISILKKFNWVKAKGNYKQFVTENIILYVLMSTIQKAAQFKRILIIRQILIPFEKDSMLLLQERG